MLIKIKVLVEGVNPIEWLEAAFRDIYVYVTRLARASDFIGISFTSESLTQGPGGMSFRPVRDFSFDDLWQLVFAVTQRAAEFNLDNAFTVKVNRVSMPLESGGKNNPLTHEEVSKRSILNIDNRDNLCLPRSLAVGKVYAQCGSVKSSELFKKWSAVRHPQSKLQKQLALELVNKSGVIVPDDGCGVNEITRFQEYMALEGIAIVVYEFDKLGKGSEPLYDGGSVVERAGRDVLHTVNIMYYPRRRHYNPILNLKAAAGGRQFCVPCNKSYRNVADHRCSNRCGKCLNIPQCPSTVVDVKCETCGRLFHGSDCLSNHRDPSSYSAGKSVCDILQICKDCSRFVNRSKSKHVCNTAYCTTCMSSQAINHLCYMRPLKSTNVSAEYIFVFYDFETQQCRTADGDNTVNIHVPNLCVAHQVCTRCIDNLDIAAPCAACGIVREYVFKVDPVREFVEFVTRPVHNFKQIICIAHNAKGFDAQFILKYLVEKMAQPPKLILNGTSIILMETGHTRFIDSLSFLPMPLRLLPGAFGLPPSSQKGLFPYLFNTRENQNYVGPLPPAEFYSPDTMSTAAREDFHEWHQGAVSEGYVFDLQKEMLTYCKSDVDILRRACIAFRRIFLECGKVCPFTEATTIASACSKVFRRNFLRPNQIGIVPPGGYRYANNQSRKAVEWLLWMEHSIGQEIIHAGRSREFRLPQGFLVDGYCELTNGERHVFEFNGCFFHGCPRCQRVNRDRELAANDTLDKRFEQTQAKAGKMRGLGYRVTEIWECEYDRQKLENPEMREYLTNHSLLLNDALNPRDAFFGGRTGCTYQLYEVGVSEKIHYLDVCSLYPYICKTGKFPVGHPKLYIGDECKELTGPTNCDISKVEGLVKCRVLAPRNLYHPVLPVRMHKKLMFPLCRACCEELLQSECPHENLADREFEGTWVSDELKVAVRKGYTITTVYEIWQYQVTRFDSATGEGGHFVEYINTFLKIKQEASGWPSACDSDLAKERYLSDYERSENIRLDRTKISKNPGLRSVSKLCLNSFWGKFGQRENLPKTEVVATRQRLMELLTSFDKEVVNIIPVNDETLYVCWSHKEGTFAPTPLSSCIVAAYTTAQARLKLYSYLEQLDQRVLYYDTDSVIFVSSDDPQAYDPPTGNFLGDLTDELACYGAGSYITRFVSGGAKFYAYIVRTPDGREIEVCKVKGITMNHTTRTKINFDSVRAMVADSAEPVNLRFRSIRRTDLHDVITRTETKTCRPVFVKRRSTENFNSLPYGYKV